MQTIFFIFIYGVIFLLVFLSNRYTSAAQDLVMHSRGKLRERNWRTADNKLATIDDISVFVIPLRPYKEEHLQWEKSRSELAAYIKSQPPGVQTL